MKRTIDSPETLWVLFKEYELETKSDPYIIIDYVGKDATTVNRMKEKALTLEDFEGYVGNIPGMPWDLDQYFGNMGDYYTKYLSVCTRIRKAIRADQIRGGLSGLYNPSITQRLNGLVDRVQTTTVKEQPLFGDEPDGPVNPSE